MLISILFCCAGFLLLYFCSEWLVKGSSSLAKSLGITPIVIGLTVVAFGTSAPELVVSLFSAIEGKNMFAVGNVIGSNICNIALVLGLSAIFNPIICSREVVKREIPVMLGVSLFLLLLSWNSVIGRIEGVILFTGVITYSYMNYKIAVNQKIKNGKNVQTDINDINHELEEIGYVSSRNKQILLIIAGIAGITGGAKLITYSAEIIMTIMGVSERFISLTVVAFGTSLPELTTSVMAAVRKETDISIGNLIGSNVFNILSVLGAVSIISPITIPDGGFIKSGLVIDYIVMMIICVIPWFMMKKDNTINRNNGITLLICYAAYLVYLFMNL